MTRQQILRYAKRVLLSLRGLVRLLPILCCKDNTIFYTSTLFFKKIISMQQNPYFCVMKENNVT